MCHLEEIERGVCMITIHHFPMARSLRVVWLMEELGEPYNLVRASFPPDAAFKALNPEGTLPFIEDDDSDGKPIRMAESIAILQYITGRRLPQAMALTVGPKPDPAAYAAHLQLLHLGEASLAGLLATISRTRRTAPDGEKENFSTRMNRELFVSRLNVVVERLKDGREWLMGEKFTIADISVGYALGFAKLIGMGDTLPDVVRAYHERSIARPAYVRAMEK